MITFFEKIENIILTNNKTINQKITGINYLEKLKYLILEYLKDLDKIILTNLITDIKKSEGQSIKYEFKDSSLLSSIYLYKDSLSRIKSVHNHNVLSIVINGFKKIAIFDFYKKK